MNSISDKLKMHAVEEEDVINKNKSENDLEIHNN